MSTAVFQEAAELEAIKQVKARVLRFLDTKDWVRLRQNMADDVRMDFSDDGAEVVVGADVFVASLASFLGGLVSVHHTHMPEIELTSPTTASGVWAMEEKLWWPDGRTAHGYGHYFDTYAKTAGHWRLTSSTLTRIRRDRTAPQQPV